jgi:Dyp-type peroxidase family
VDALLLLYAVDRAELERSLQEHRDLLRRTGGIAEVALETGHRPDSPKEMMGFNDCISQPAVAGFREDRVPGERVIQPGAFLLGHPNEYGVLPPTPAVPDGYDPRQILPRLATPTGYRDIGRNGTYLVFHKLEQDVAAFWRYIQHQAGGDEREMIVLASKFVGRWPSGAPLMLAPEWDDPALGGDRERNNDFNYLALDPMGFRCPIGAHIRRSNPRDSLSGDPPAVALTTTGRHQLLRRGVPYGDPLFRLEDLDAGKPPKDLRPDGKPRGLHFLALNASIGNQFEFVMQEWFNNGHFQGLFGTRTPSSGTTTARARWCSSADRREPSCRAFPVS